MKQKLLLALVTVILAGSLFGGAKQVYANNHRDREFSFSYYADGTDQSIRPREKMDNTASYMKNNASSTDLMVCVAGTNSISKYPGINPNRCSGVGLIPKGSYRYMSNNVYGRYKYAYLVMGADDKRTHTVSGKWSSDNISGRY